MRDKVIGKKWIYSGGNIFHRQNVGHLRRSEWPIGKLLTNCGEFKISNIIMLQNLILWSYLILKCSNLFNIMERIRFSTKEKMYLI